MILEHFQLRRPPFEAVADSRFYFPAAGHQQALALLHYAARNAGEAALVCGPAGCGKTLVLRTVRRQLPREQFTVVFAPHFGPADPLEELARFLPPGSAPAEAPPHARLMALARTCAESGRTLVLMLDDLDPATPRTLDTLGLLTQLDVDDLRVSLLLAARDDPPRPSDRLLGVARVGPLPEADVPAYLAHRLRVAGHPTGEPFDPDAARLIARRSAGVPRTIHRIANLAMHLAALASRRRVRAADVEHAADRLVRLAAAPPATTEAHA